MSPDYCVNHVPDRSAFGPQTPSESPARTKHEIRRTVTPRVYCADPEFATHSPLGPHAYPYAAHRVKREHGMRNREAAPHPHIGRYRSQRYGSLNANLRKRKTVSPVALRCVLEIRNATLNVQCPHW